MRKEVLWAIIAGITFGLVIAFGVVRINSSLKPKGITTQDPTPFPSGVPNDQSEFKITLNKPEQDDVITTNPVIISGITKAKSSIIISSEEDDYLAVSDDKGFFEEDIDVISGVNQITITAFDSDNNQARQKVLVVYSSSFEEKEGDRLERAANKPKAHLGTVTDITDSTIQVRTLTSEIKQISVNPDISVTKTFPTSKIVKLADIAIGDFIVAMGYRNGNQVLSAQRILITLPVVEPRLTITKDVGEKVTPVKTTSVYLFEDNKVSNTKATEIEDDDQIISVNTEIDGKSSPRSIFIIR